MARRPSYIVEASRRGKDTGESAASWIDFDEDSAKVFLQGWEDGDPAVLDRIEPPSWLSGEYAGESINELLGDLIEDHEEEADDIETEYEQAATDAYWNELQKRARYYVRRSRKPRKRLSD